MSKMSKIVPILQCKCHHRPTLSLYYIMSPCPPPVGGVGDGGDGEDVQVPPPHPGHVGVGACSGQV